MWDVMGEDISSEAFASKIQQLRAGFLFYQKNPNIWRDRVRLFGILSIIIAVAGFTLMFFVDSETGDIVLRGTGVIVFILLAGLFSMIRAGGEIKKDMVKLLIGEKHGWIFNPEASVSRLNELQKKFSILNRGGGVSVDDQYWGVADINGKPTNFWMALHHYTTGTGKHKKSHVATLMAFRLPHLVVQPFFVREGIEGGFFKKQDVQLESIEFNKIFVVKHMNATQSEASEILQILTPATQQRFVALAKKFEHFSAAFFGDVGLFSVDTDLLTPFYVSVFTKFEVDPRDEKLMNDRMAEMFAFAGEMIQFVD